MFRFWLKSFEMNFSLLLHRLCKWQIKGQTFFGLKDQQCSFSETASQKFYRQTNTYPTQYLQLIKWQIKASQNIHGNCKLKNFGEFRGIFGWKFFCTLKYIKSKPLISPKNVLKKHSLTSECIPRKNRANRFFSL